MNAQRILTVVAAALFVGAVALATIGTEPVSLSQALGFMTNFGAETVRGWVIRVCGPGMWRNVAEPLLIRPAWLPFASLGLICAGIALSLRGGDAPRRSHRRG